MSNPHRIRSLLVSTLALLVGYGSPPRVAPSQSNSAVPVVVQRIVLGESVGGRPIRAVELGDATSPAKVLVIGCVHGDERAGIRVARLLIGGEPPSSVDLWVIPDLNPDGRAARTRGNLHGVDLNRNFPYRWAAAPRDRYYSGTHALSEPESRIARHLIQELQPKITIWFHQPLGLVDRSGGNVEVERRYARLVGLPLVRLTRYPGSAVGWSNHRFAGTTSFVVELPAGPLPAARARVFANSVLELVAPTPRHR